MYTFKNEGIRDVAIFWKSAGHFHELSRFLISRGVFPAYVINFEKKTDFSAMVAGRWVKSIWGMEELLSVMDEIQAIILPESDMLIREIEDWLYFDCALPLISESIIRDPLYWE